MATLNEPSTSAAHTNSLGSQGDLCSRKVSSGDEVLLSPPLVVPDHPYSNGKLCEEIHEELDDDSLTHLRNSREETPLISMANGQGGSSQEDDEEEESGSDCGLIGGKLQQSTENEELLQTCSSRSGSSMWSESGSNEQEHTQYGLLESGSDNENLIPGEPLSLPSDQPKLQGSDSTKAPTPELEEEVPSLVSPSVERDTTITGEEEMEANETLTKGEPPSSMHLVGRGEEDVSVQDSLIEEGEGGERRGGGDEENSEKAERNGEMETQQDDNSQIQEIETEMEETEGLQSPNVETQHDMQEEVIKPAHNETHGESNGGEVDERQYESRRESITRTDGEVYDGSAYSNSARDEVILQNSAVSPEDPPSSSETDPVTPPPPSPPPPAVFTTQPSNISNNDLRVTSSIIMNPEESDDALLESNLDISNLDSGVRPPRSDPRTNLPILQPLSPDPDLNEQYEYLRRTLSHSQRRYSTRRRRPQRRDNRQAGVQRSESSAAVGRVTRDILRSRDQRPVETHVDVHGRTYFMDHDTHTVAYAPGQTTATDISRGMEMLERRYQSLQRSFRGGQRPNRFTQPNLTAIPASPSTPLDLSLSLTRAEAESISNSRTSRAQSGASNSKKKSSRRWFWQRSSRSVSQSRTASSADDDILPVSPGWEGSPPPAVTATGEVVERRRERREESVETGSRSSDATLSGSVAGTTSEEGEEERATSEEPQPPHASVSSEEVLSGGAEEVVSTTRSQEGDSAERGGGEGEERVGGGGGGRDEVFTATPTGIPSRQHSIMRATGMATADRNAASRARHRVRATTVRGRQKRRGTDRDTDDETNEALARHVQTASPTPEEEGEGQEGEGQEGEVVKEQPASPTTPTSPSPLPEGLVSSPALRFITRRDLYSFLNKAGDAGEGFLANRGLMELVQRIRTNNNLFSKYQHSRQLVTALNRFADTKADLPSNWEKKLNREGKVFFIDHSHCATSFIDPRLPLPDHKFTYTSPATTHPSLQPQQLQFGEEAPIRAHHTTVLSSSGVQSPPPLAATTSPPPPAAAPTVSITGPQPSQNVEMTYERQVVSFFRFPDVYQRISQRYQRGVRPQLRDIIEDVRANGTSALERIQTSGSVAAYELALVLSLFEEDISAVNRMIELTAPQPIPTRAVPTEERVTGGPLTVSTLQRKKEAFSTKLQNFKVMMARLGFAQSSRLKFNIRRDHLLEDSYEHVMKSDVRHLQRKRLNICFRGEEGLDYGGPSREFFFLLSRELFNPYYGLFEYSANDTYTVQISSTSMFIQNNLDWFRFAGRVIGLVIVQGFLLDVFFTRTIYKALANRMPSLKDLESLEPAFYSSLVWIRDNDPEPLDLTFTVEEEAFGELTTHELKEGGMDLPVTDDNKEEYVHLMLRWRLDRGITSQMNMLRKGFAEVMPVSLLQAFDASELEFLTAGTLEIDIEDWKKHSEYRNGYHPTHPVILHFWQAVEMFDNEQRLRLLQFVTGTSSVPFEGFKALRGSNGPKRFTIDFFSDVNSLPRTHTCFNRIDLPPYSSYEVLYQKLVIAIEEGNTFGIE